MKVEAWVVVDPDGRVLVDSRDFYNAEAAWCTVLGWPSDAEIEIAKGQGWRVFRASVTIEPTEEAALLRAPG